MKRIMVAFAICVLGLTACGRETVETTQNVFAMDTYMTLTAYGSHGKKAVKEAVKEIERLDALLSTGKSDSEVTALNRTAEAFLSEDTADLWEKSTEVFAKTNGAFDVTVYPVMRAWGFTDGAYRVPKKEELQRLLQKVDSSAVVYDADLKKLTLPKDAEIDFGGIAKGYTAEKVAQIMQDNGVKSALINLGGNVKLLGGKPDGESFHIAVQSPEHDGNYLGILHIKDVAAVTSGGYERNFVSDGVTYHHIIDPDTGYPAENGLCSVTVVSKDATLADAYSTALFVMGTQDAVSFWKAHTEEFEAVLWTTDGELLITEGLESVFTSSRAYEVIEK